MASGSIGSASAWPVSMASGFGFGSSDERERGDRGTQATQARREGMNWKTGSGKTAAGLETRDSLRCTNAMGRIADQVNDMAGRAG